MDRVIVVDDDVSFLQYMQSVLGSEVEDLVLLGSYEDFQEYHQKVGCLGCYVRWLDIALPGESGWACLRGCAGFGVIPNRVVFCSGIYYLDDERYRPLFKELSKKTDVVVLQKPLIAPQILQAVSGDVECVF